MRWMRSSSIIWLLDYYKKIYWDKDSGLLYVSTRFLDETVEFIEGSCSELKERRHGTEMTPVKSSVPVTHPELE
jgi:hypothetical protein